MVLKVFLFPHILNYDKINLVKRRGQENNLSLVLFFVKYEVRRIAVKIDL